MPFDLATMQSMGSALFWQSVGMVAVIGLIMLIVLIVGVIGFFGWIKLTYKTKVHYFHIYGNPKISEIIEPNGEKTFKVDTTNCTIGKESITHGKTIKKKQSQYFLILRPRKKVPLIEQSLMTEDGVYFLLINNNFVPIYKPQMQYKTANGATISETIISLYSLQQWNALRMEMIQETEQKYPERDVQIRIFAMFIVAMICIVVIFGIMMWLSYQMYNKAIDKADSVVSTIQQWGAAKGIGAPN